MMSQDAAQRAEELAVTCDHTWGVVRGKGACAACIVRFVDAAVAEAVKARDAEIKMLRGACREKEQVGDGLIVQLADAHKERDRLYMEMGKTIARQTDEARRAERAKHSDPGVHLDGGHYCAICYDDSLRPASAPEGETK